MDLTLTFASERTIDLRADPAVFRILARELDEQGLGTLSASVAAHARAIAVADHDQAAVGRALAATIAHA